MTQTQNPQALSVKIQEVSTETKSSLVLTLLVSEKIDYIEIVRMGRGLLLLNQMYK